MYYEGNDFVSKDVAKAKELYGKAAGLNYSKAKEKMTMLD